MAHYELDTGQVRLAESLLQTPLFDDEIRRSQAATNPAALPWPALSQRGAIVQTVANMAAEGGAYDAEDLRKVGRRNATDLKLLARQLILLKNIEGYDHSRTPLEHMEAAHRAGNDAYARLARFFQISQAPNTLTGVPAYDVVRKEGRISSRTQPHQDRIMATLLHKTGIGAPASSEYPLPLRALVVTPTDTDTYRLAFRRTGNSIFQQIAPDIRFITTRRYTGLVKNHGETVVVTNPDFLEQAVRSGRMTNIQYDLVLTEGFTAAERPAISDLVHEQTIGPVIVHFTLSSEAQNLDQETIANTGDEGE